MSENNLVLAYQEANKLLRTRIREILEVLHDQQYEYQLESYHVYSQGCISSIFVEGDYVQIDFLYQEPWEDWDEHGSLCVPIQFFTEVLDKEALLEYFDREEERLRKECLEAQIREAFINAKEMNLLDKARYDLYANTFNGDTNKFISHLYENNLY